MKDAEAAPFADAGAPEGLAGADSRPEWRWRDGTLSAANVELAVELPIAFEYNGIAHAVMLASPQDLEDFALGFSLSEGIIARATDLYGMESRQAPAGITLDLQIASEAFARLKDRRRTLAGRTGCGICGTESLDQVLRPLPALAAANWRLAPAALARASAALGPGQDLSRRTGATHGAAWCDAEGTVALVREDVGRHNALDKLIGAMVRAGIESGAGFALITSRASVEMVQKAATAGISVLAAVSGPTTLAVEVAQRCGLCLVGFARGEHFSIYSHHDRIAA